MADAKTRPTGEPFDAFLERVEPPRRQKEARVLDALFRDVTRWAPVVWTGGLVGYGVYDYRYDSGRSGRFLATGFAPRKAQSVVYILPGYRDFGQILERIGPHRAGAACVYLGRLEAIDLDALRDLVRAGLDELSRLWTVTGT